ncbi:thermonuclease family protein [Desulfocurvibacter africanus]|uniref:thermonuclease family protein n=1 Tax=Desulfocurvibacter africanus TaxID=873 RepID=UPI002FD9C8E0
MSPLAARLVFTFILLLLPTQLLAWEGYVIQVHDGDTITVMDPERGRVKIRLYGIDCPELDQPGGSLAFMLMHRQMVEGETVDVDRYGREVALVKVKGADVSTTLVQAGHAWVYERYCLRDECDTWGEAGEEGQTG